VKKGKSDPSVAPQRRTQIARRRAGPSAGLVFAIVEKNSFRHASALQTEQLPGDL